MNAKHTLENYYTGKTKIFISCISIFYFSVLVPIFCLSQNIKAREVISINAGIGSLTFYGDIGSKSIAEGYSFMRSGYFLSIEKEIKKNISLSVHILKGKIAREGQFSDDFPKLNFQSPLTQFGLNGIFSMLIKEEQSVIPFLSAGFSFLLCDPYGDLLDKNENTYYYWNDGSIRNLP